MGELDWERNAIVWENLDAGLAEWIRAIKWFEENSDVIRAFHDELFGPANAMHTGCGNAECCGTCGNRAPLPYPFLCAGRSRVPGCEHS